MKNYLKPLPQNELKAYLKNILGRLYRIKYQESINIACYDKFMDCNNNYLQELPYWLFVQLKNHRQPLDVHNMLLFLYM